MQVPLALANGAQFARQLRGGRIAVVADDFQIGVALAQRQPDRSAGNAQPDNAYA
jgi:hypothetical protein